MISTIKITPLGGVGEIGALNCMVYENDHDAIIVDCGSQFPDDDDLGIDLIIPDFSYLKEIRHKLRGLVLTHGHEDHIGAVPFLLREFDLPVYGTAFTLGLVRRKLLEHAGVKAQFHLVKQGDFFEVGPFELESLYINHSIIDAMAVAIHTSQGVVMHLTDWKIDKHSLDGRCTDLKRFSQLGKKGVLALLCDSTNVDQPGSTLSEREVAKQIKKICSKHQGRILVTLFASNIHRVQSLAHIAQSLGRKLAFLGRSMKENTTLARELGQLKLDGLEILDIEEAQGLPDKELMVLATGSQGEERAALSRIAYNQFKAFQLRDGDMVLFSSKIIPGNEKNIFGVIDNLYRSGARVLYESVHEMHTSGHAHQEELKEAIKRLKPKHFIPIHGAYHHLVKHRNLAIKAGVKLDHAIVIENGQPLIFDGGFAYPDEPVKIGRIFVDGRGVGDVNELVMRDRRQLADTGIITCVLMIDRLTGEIVRGPDFVSRGFAHSKENPDLFDRAKQHLLKGLQKFEREDWTNSSRVQEEVRVNLRQFFKKELERKPVVIPIVLEI